MFETDLQKTIFYGTYSRWNAEKQRRETWEETCARVIGFLASTLVKHCKTPDIKADISMTELYNAMLNMEVMPSMRIVQMAGPVLERCNVGAYNCSYLPLLDWRAFSELLYILMQGTGVGFSVEQRYIDRLPVISAQSGLPPTKFIIEDTTEGWCNALQFGLCEWGYGTDVEFDYSYIRPYGAPLKTKGGKASGPEPLKQLLTFARKLLLNHQGRKLSSLNAHDLACYCGSIVQVGGIRRAAEISLSDLSDHKMRDAKSGQFWLKAPERAMSNNSAVYTSKPSMGDFMGEWTALMNSGTGERGIFNRTGVIEGLPTRRQQNYDMGLNPCGEIILRPFEFCNLSIAVARPEDTIEDLARKVKLATQFGIIQSLLTDFKYIRPEWKKNCEEERLLGVDITGQMDCPVLNGSVPGTSVKAAYSALQRLAVGEAHHLAKQLNIPIPAAVTCVKPSGNSSQLLNTSSGIHPRFAPYYIRRVRLSATNPVSSLLISSGVPHFPEVGQVPDNPTIWVFEFPVSSPNGAVTRNDVTAIQQLAQWEMCKRHYTEHNPSCTIFVKEDEWLEVGAWVYKNWDIVGGLSFLPFDGGVYMLAPYTACSKEEYEQRQSTWPIIDWSTLKDYETEDGTEVNREFSCTSGSCDL